MHAPSVRADRGPLAIVCGLVAVLALLALPTPAEAGTSTVALNEVDCGATGWVELFETAATPRCRSRTGCSRTTRSIWFRRAMTTGCASRRGRCSRPGPTSSSLKARRASRSDSRAATTRCVSPTPTRSSMRSRCLCRAAPGRPTAASPTRRARGRGRCRPWVRQTRLRPTSADDPAWLYDPLQVTEVDLEASPAALAQLSTVPDEYVEARITLRSRASTYGPYVVGLRSRVMAPSARWTARPPSRSSSATRSRGRASTG